MKSKTFRLPATVRLEIPKDYATSAGPRAIQTLCDRSKRGLTVRWDDERIQFLADKGGVSILRDAILGFQVDRNRRVMSWRLCELSVELPDAVVPVLYAEKKDESL